MNRLLLLIIAFSAIGVSAETRIKGDLTGMNLDESGNPFIVEQDIIVPDGQKVVIKEGCVFLFNPFTGLQVLGELQVNGKQDKPVIFTSVYDNQFNPESPQLPNPFDWNGILVTRESGNVSISNFQLQYSVYGIKSQNPGIKVQNGIFKQNGQFHFTIMDKIQFVQDNISYSFNQQDQDPGTGTGGGGTGKGKDNNKGDRKGTSNGVKIFRFASLGVGVAGLVAGVFFAAQLPDARDNVNEVSEQIKSRNSPSQEYSKAEDAYYKKLAGTIIGGSAFVLGVTGFAISFTF